MFESWDPENSGIFNKKFGYNSRTKKFEEDKGDFYHYTPVRGNSQYFDDFQNGLYWNTAGEVFYEDGKGSWIPLTDFTVDENGVSKNIKPLGGLFDYASDAQLDAVADKIRQLKTLKQAEVIKLRTETTPKQVKERADQISASPVETPAPASTTTTDDNTYAEMRLQNLIAAEEAQEPQVAPKVATTYYSYGPSLIDLKYYLHNLGTNLLNYLNSKDWSTAQKNAFKTAYENYKAGLTEQLNNKSSRFRTDDSGTLIDTQGLLDGKKNRVYIDREGNTYNSLDEITDKKLRKSAVEFSPNDEVANYFNTVGQAIVSAGKTHNAPATVGDFDLVNNGFVKYWSNKVNPTGLEIDLTPYIQLDTIGADGKRSKTNRTKYLAYLLGLYLKNINNSNYNFENTPFKTKENYTQKIQQAITNLNNGWDSSDAASLLAIGITPDMYNAFMSDGISREALEAKQTEDEAKKKADAEAAFIEKTKTKFDEYVKTGKFTESKPLSFTVDKAVPNFNEGDSSLSNYILPKLLKLGYRIDPSNNLQASVISAAMEELKSKVTNGLRLGKSSVNINGNPLNLSEILSFLIPMLILNLDLVLDETGAYILDDPDNDGAQGAILCYKDDKVYYDWIFNHPKSTSYKNLVRRFDSTYNAPTGLTRYAFVRKEGGLINKFAEGGAAEEIPIVEISPELLAAYQAANNTETQSETQPETPPKKSFGDFVAHAIYSPGETAAKAKGMSYLQYMLKLRSPNEAATAMNPNSGVWKTEDYARMGAILADITSLVLDPVSGTIVGVGSTATNFVADWLDNSVTATEMWKNLGANLGMDALGIVPIVGDVAGTGGKLLKSIKTIAPKLMYGLTAYGTLGTLKNMPNIMESLKKVTSDEKLTVGDYQNIAQAITAVAGLNSGLKSTVAKKLAKKNAAVDDAIGIGLRRQGSDHKLDFIFEGEHAKKIKELAAANKTEELNKYIQNLEGFANYEVNTNLRSLPIGSRLPVGRTVGDDGKKHWGVQSPLSIERQIDAFTIYDPNKIKGTSYASRNLLNTSRLNAVSVGNRYKNEDLITIAEADNLARELLRNLAEESGAIRATENRKKAKEQIEADLNGIVDPEGKVTTVGAKEKFNDSTKTLKDLRNEFEVIRKQIKDLEAKGVTVGKHDLKSPLGRYDALTEIDNSIKQITLDLDTLNKDKAFWEESLKDAKTQADKDTAVKEIENINIKIDALNKLNLDLNLQEILVKANESLENKLAQYSTENKNAKSLKNRVTTLEKRLKFINDPNRKSRQTLSLYDLFKDDKPFEVNWGNNGHREVDNATVLKILNDLNLLKKGGNLKHRAIKAASGVQLKDPSNSWYNLVFSNYQLEILDRISKNRDYYKTINNMQTAHHDIYTEAGGANGNWDKTAHQGTNNSVKNYQLQYNNEGFNTLGISPNFGTRYAFSPQSKRISGDNLSKSYIADNLYSSITDDRRVLGRSGDWTDSQIQNFNNELKKHQLEMHLGDGDYYYIGELQKPESPLTLIPGPNTDLQEIQVPEGLAGGPTGKGLLDTKGKSKLNIPDILNGVPAYTNAFLRYKILDNNNRRIAEHAMANEKPFYLNPQLDYIKVRSDLRSEMEGARLQAELERRAQHTVSVDTSKQMNFLKELWLEGLKRKEAGLAQSDAVYRDTSDKSKLQDIINHTAEHKVGEANRLAAHQSESNKAKIWNAYLTKRASSLDTLLSKIEYDLEAKKKKQDAYTEQAKLAEMQSAVSYNPNKYGANLSSEELNAYNKVLAGTSPSSLSASELQALTTAKGKITQAVTRLKYQILGVPETEYSLDAINRPTVSAPTITLSDLDITKAKDGTKLEIAKLRKRVKDADRYSKSVEKKLDNVTKQLDRISKSMYGVPKLKMV